MAKEYAIQRMADGEYLALGSSGIDWTKDPESTAIMSFVTRTEAEEMRTALELKGTGIARLPTHGRVKVG